MNLLLESVKKWYSDYKNAENINYMSNFISNLKRSDNILLIESINDGFDIITTNLGYDIPSLMKRADILCEHVANTINDETSPDTLKSEMSPKIQNKFIRLLEPIISKITEYYEDPEVIEDITPMLLMWALKESKEFDGKLLNDDMTAIDNEFIKYLHKGVNTQNKTIPLIYLVASKLANQTKVKSKTFENKPTTSKEVDIDTSRLVSSLSMTDAKSDVKKLFAQLQTELTDMNEWAKKSGKVKPFKDDILKMLKIKLTNPGITDADLLKEVPSLPKKVSSTGVSKVHPQIMKRSAEKLKEFFKEPKFEKFNELSDLISALETERDEVDAAV